MTVTVPYSEDNYPDDSVERRIQEQRYASSDVRRVEIPKL